MQVDEATWAAIQSLHETTNEPHTQLAIRFTVGRGAIRERALSEKWGPRPARPKVIPLPRIERVPPSESKTSVPIARPKRAARTGPDTAEARIARFFHLIDIQLDNLEILMTTGEPLSAEDELRKANYFKTIVGSLEKVTEIDKANTAGSEHAQGAATGDRHLKAEKLRRDIAQRLERLNAQWNAQAKPE